MTAQVKLCLRFTSAAVRCDIWMQTAYWWKTGAYKLGLRLASNKQQYRHKKCSPAV